MEIWFSELHTSNVKLSVRIDKQLFSGESEYQRIDVFESQEFGKFVALDGDIVFSDKDEFIYDEMVTHVPMAVHPDVRNVLIIGGGDGGVAKELLQYPSIESIDVVETDKLFVDVCRDIFPEVACGLDDKRVKVYYDDGLRFLRNKKEEYDLIINDSTIRLDILRDFSPKSFMEAAIRRLRAMELWFISTAVLFMTKMSWLAEACTGRFIVPSLSAVFIRLIFQPARQATGCLDLHQKNITPLMTLNLINGTK